MDTRERLLDATARLIQRGGIMAVTTKDVAREAGFAEATLYRHFQDKTDLLLCVLSERVPGHFLQQINALPQRAGEGSVAGNLEQLTAAAMDFFSQTAALTMASGADPTIAVRHFARLRELGSGPENALKMIAAYLEAERQLGRICADASPAAVATILLGVCGNYAQLRHVAGEAATLLPPERFAHEIVQTVMNGIGQTPGSQEPEHATDPALGSKLPEHGRDAD